MNTTTLTLNINAEQIKQIKALAGNRNKTMEEMAVQIFNDGLKDKLYRLRRNAQKYQETKALKERLAELEETLMKLPTEQLEELVNETVDEEV